MSLAGAELVSKVLTFAAFASLARSVGADDFGYVEWAAAVLLCAGLIVDQGFGLYGAREIAKAPERTAELIAEIIGARIFLAAGAFCIVLLMAFFLKDAGTTRNLLILYGISLFAAPFILTWVFQGLEKMHSAALVQVVRQTIFAGMVLTLVMNQERLWLVPIAEIVSVSIAAALSVWIVKAKLKFGVRVALGFSADLFRQGVPIGLSQMLWVVKVFGATLIVGLIASAEDTGRFAGAMRIYTALHTFVWLYYFNLLPTLSRAWHDGRAEFAAVIRKSMVIVISLSVVAGAIWVAAAPLVMTIVYGPEFTGGGGALQWLGGACVAAAVSGHFRFGLVAAGYQRSELATAAIGAAAAVILIPIGYVKMGTAGAAAALFTAEVLVLLTSWLMARQRVFSGGTASIENGSVANSVA
jgi:O-antigen/teichoic acid export membrane protein